jgi:vancomycin permeability regulator SanA
MTARIFALFFALLTLLNLAGNLVRPGFDASIWWISFGPWPEWISRLVLCISAMALFGFAFKTFRPAQRSPLIAAAAAMLAAVALANIVTFYWLVVTGKIVARFPVPFSLIVCFGMVVVAGSAWAPSDRLVRANRWKVAAGGMALFGVFPLALMLFFGNTDYRRPADVAVVFGARAYADGRLSDALEDRIRAACELYRSGLVKKIVLSGGPGDGAITESAAMRNYALRHGVRAEDVFLDDAGWNTESTVQNTVPLFRQWQAQRILVVSHFYHLPRIKMAYQRAGVEVCTVPARQGHYLSQMPYNMAREVAAFWAYYLKQKPTVVASIPTAPRSERGEQFPN